MNLGANPACGQMWRRWLLLSTFGALLVYWSVYIDNWHWNEGKFSILVKWQVKRCKFWSKFQGFWHFINSGLDGISTRAAHTTSQRWEKMWCKRKFGFGGDFQNFWAGDCRKLAAEQKKNWNEGKFLFPRALLCAQQSSGLNLFVHLYSLCYKILSKRKVGQVLQLVSSRRTPGLTR